MVFFTRIIPTSALLVLLLCQAVSATTNVEEQLRFAQWLMTQGEYYRAITEYERVLFYASPDDAATRGTALLGVGQALAAGQEYDRAGEWLYLQYRELRALDLRSEATSLMARAFLRADASQRLLGIIDEEIFSPDDSLYYGGLALARGGNWHEARAGLGSVNSSSPHKAQASHNEAVSLTAIQASWKNPTTAGWLGVFPGAGYVYAGHTQTGIASFIVNGVFWVATYQAFNADQNVLGAFLAVLSVSWYASNIYGSVQAAKRYNVQLQEDLWSRMEY